MFYSQIHEMNKRYEENTFKLCDFVLSFLTSSSLLFSPIKG